MSLSNLFQVLARLVQIICPLIAIRAVYALIVDIITSVPQFYLAVNIEIFTLADILIRGMIYFVTYAAALGLGFPNVSVPVKNTGTSN